MESGEGVLRALLEHRLDLIDAMVMAVNDSVSDEALAQVEKNARPVVPARYVHRELHELPERGHRPGPAGNGTTLATQVAQGAVPGCRPPHRGLASYYEQDDESVLPVRIATKEAFENAMALDVAMGGSTNTVALPARLRTRRALTSP